MRKSKTLAWLCLVTLGVFAMRCQGGGAQEVRYALRGTVVTPDEDLESATILVAGGRIQALGTGINVSPELVIDVGGIILPGFVDLHNHLTWNVFPRWKPRKEFANRYEWQAEPIYNLLLATPHAQLVDEHLGCDMNRYAEVKAIAQGETSVVGSLDPPQKCIEGLARNLDFYSGFYQPGVLGSEKLRYEVFPLELSASAAGQIIEELEKGKLTAFIVHLAEGKRTDAGSAREFKMFTARGFLRPGVSIIHGSSLKDVDFRQMADKQVGLIWAPRSNLELYGETTDVVSALREHVKIALSPDWSPTGSDGILQELKFAATWNGGQQYTVFTNKDLVRMATEYPAQLAGLGGEIGTLAAGYAADLLVLKRTHKDPYDSVVHAGPADVRLVIVGGVPIYGDLDLMKHLLPHQQLQIITTCGFQKAVYFGSEAMTQGVAPKPWSQTVNDLSIALDEWSTSLAPLVECGD